LKQFKNPIGVDSPFRAAAQPTQTWVPHSCGQREWDFCFFFIEPMEIAQEQLQVSSCHSHHEVNAFSVTMNLFPHALGARVGHPGHVKLKRSLRSRDLGANARFQ